MRPFLETIGLSFFTTAAPLRKSEAEFALYKTIRRSHAKACQQTRKCFRTFKCVCLCLGFELDSAISFLLVSSFPPFLRSHFYHCWRRNNFVKLLGTFCACKLKRMHVRYLWIHRVVNFQLRTFSGGYAQRVSKANRRGVFSSLSFGRSCW